MKKTALLSLVSIFCLFNTHAQDTWERFYDELITETFCQTSDGNYVLAGIRTEPMLYHIDMFKTDSIGIKTWENSYFCNSYKMNFVYPTNDSGFLLCGSEGLMLLYDKNNQLLWEKQFINYFPHGVVSSNNGFILAGFRYNESFDQEPFIMEINSTGDSLWTKTDFSNEWRKLQQILKASDGGYFLNAETDDGASVLIKTDQNFQTEWIEDFDYINGYKAVFALSNDSCILAGGHSKYSYVDEVYFNKIDEDGVLIWMQSVSDEAYDDLQCMTVAGDHDGGLIAGIKMIEEINNVQNMFRPWIQKIGPNGEEPWLVKRHDVLLEITRIISTADSMYVFHGRTKPLGQSRLIKMAPGDGSIITGINDHEAAVDRNLFTYPNPFNTEINISLSAKQSGTVYLLDVAGKVAMEKKFVNKKNVLLNTSSLNRGMYFYEVKLKQNTFAGKIIKE